MEEVGKWISDHLILCLCLLAILGQPDRHRRHPFGEKKRKKEISREGI